MTRFSYSEVKAAYAAVQAARVNYLPTFSKIEKTVDAFAVSPDLTGVGWSAAKEAISPYTVVSKALYNYHCDFGETSAALLASFESEVGETTKVVDTEQLRDLQDRLNRIQQEKADLMETMATNILNGLMDTAGIGVFYKDFQIGQTQKKVDLLEKYEAFETNHANDFSELVALGNELEQAMDDLGNSKSFDKKTGTYTYVNCSGKDWYKKLSDYNDSSPTQRIEIVQTDDYGYGLKVYIDGHYNKQASDNLMYAQSQAYLKEMGRTAVTMTGELTGAYDVYRLFTGKDPLTGDKTGRLEAGLWTAILLLPQAKMVMAAKELKAGNKALKGLNLTEKELNLLNKAGYFDDVGKLEKISGAGGLGSGNIGDFSNLQGSNVDDLLSRIPADANKRVLTPQPGKVTEGFEYTWKASDGTKMTVRVHGPDASAPTGSNAANGWIVRVQQGKKYFDPVSGTFQPPGISRPNSEFYNEELINSTHIPIQTPKK
ncbi:polymorphic toxin type 30 domain-containing protein [Carnobacterium gallinarum]|uniref:polymorphic toxin type 30 domain-containing protein n=1 Tax=Carnobacterium gallinarum TaxID=2749 RepID=UPI00054FB033|nr:polymorphic toxin type 30 domain-containing protein [Carnobacterium gallinarum]